MRFDTVRLVPSLLLPPPRTRARARAARTLARVARFLVLVQQGPAAPLTALSCVHPGSARFRRFGQAERRLRDRSIRSRCRGVSRRCLHRASHHRGPLVRKFRHAQRRPDQPGTDCPHGPDRYRPSAANPVTRQVQAQMRTLPDPVPVGFRPRVSSQHRVRAAPGTVLRRHSCREPEAAVPPLAKGVRRHTRLRRLGAAGSNHDAVSFDLGRARRTFFKRRPGSARGRNPRRHAQGLSGDGTLPELGTARACRGRPGGVYRVMTSLMWRLCPLRGYRSAVRAPALRCHSPECRPYRESRLPSQPGTRSSPPTRAIV